MTVYVYSKCAVYAELAGALRLARNMRAFVTNPVTGVPVNVTQGAFTAPYFDSDNTGIADFTSTTPGPIRLTVGAVFTDVFSEELPSLGLAAIPIVAASAADAAASAVSAATSASLVGAPADTAVAAIVGSGASATSVSLKGQYAPLTAKVYTSTSGDQTTALQAFLTALVDGDEALIRGTINFTTVTIARNNVTIRLAPGAVLNKTTALTDGVVVTGTNVRIEDGTITCPATFDGTNSQWTYAVIRTTAAGLSVKGVTLTNVPRVGIGALDTDDLSVIGCTIVGNYPAGSYTGVETGHFGITVDPGASGRSGRTIITGNMIRSCVQGVFLGNYGSGSGYGANIVGNIFDGCHNHGVYGSTGWAATTVTGNSFARCSLPVALNGIGHVVSGNTLYTDGTGNNLDLVGISIREASGCAITGNTITGDAPVGAVILECGNYTGTTISRNIISDNMINVTGGSSIGIRVGRSPQTTDCSDNIIANNIVRTVGTAGSGAITLSTATSGTGNEVTGNDVIVRGESHGIKGDLVTHSTISGNIVRFEYDAPIAKTLGGIVLNATDRCTVGLNDIYCTAAWGTLVALRGVWEQSTSTKNRIIQNGYHGDLTKLASFTPIVLITNSDAYLDERGIGTPTGAFYGAPGSRWSREDGGVSTSLYVKETANTSATWRAV